VEHLPFVMPHFQNCSDCPSYPLPEGIAEASRCPEMLSNYKRFWQGKYNRILNLRGPSHIVVLHIELRLDYPFAGVD
jgi:hypothetical protein